jgi:hypothetical protein
VCRVGLLAIRIETKSTLVEKHAFAELAKRVAPERGSIEHCRPQQQEDRAGGGSGSASDNGK